MLVNLLKLLGGTLFLSALFTPFVYSFLVWISDSSIWPFSRVFDRVAMVCALLMVWILRREFPVSGVVAEIRGSFPVRSGSKQLFLGICLTATSVFCVLPFLVDGVNVSWQDRASYEICGKIFRTIPAALLIGLIEESFFRFFLLRRVREKYPPVAAIFFVSLLYAFVHFITPVKAFSYNEFSPLAGFSYLFAVVERLLAPGLIPAFIGLFLVGVVLGGVMERTKSLPLVIGLHAGWIVGLKTVKYLAYIPNSSTVLPGAGSRYFLVADPVAWLSIVGVGGLCTYLWKSRLVNNVNPKSLK